MQSARLTYRVRDGLRLSAIGDVSSKSYLLEDRGGEIGKGRLRNREARVGVGVDWKFLEHWRLRARTGVMIWEQYKVYDEDNDEFDAKSSDDPAWFGRLRVEYRF